MEKSKEDRMVFKVLLLGDAETGKTSLMQRFCNNSFQVDYKPSIGLDFQVKAIDIDGTEVKLQIWDPPSIEAVIISVLEKVHAVMLVFGISNGKSYYNLLHWLILIDLHANKNVRKILVGNKCDLECERIITKETGKTTARENNMKYCETSAKLNSNVNEVFKEITSDILHSIVYPGLLRNFVEDRERSRKKSTQMEQNNGSPSTSIITRHRSRTDGDRSLTLEQVYLEKFDKATEKYQEVMDQKYQNIGIGEFESLHLAAVEAAAKQLDTLAWKGIFHYYTRCIDLMKEKYKNDRLHRAEIKKYRDEIAKLNKQREEFNDIFSFHYKPADIQIAACENGLLGQGGYGKVRTGFIKELDIVAIKLITLTGSSLQIQDKRKKFDEECKYLHRASHANVVRIEGYSTCQNTMAYIMEYMPGGNLHDLLLRKISDQFRVPIISPWLRLRFCCDITSGVAYLHHGFTDQRMVHGDLKPENILLTTDLKCKVADFGGADLATCTELLTQTTQPHRSVQYTRGYAAPELFSADRKRVARSMDVYSVGMIMLVILRRERPPQVGLSHSNEERTRFNDEIEKLKGTLHPNDSDVIDLLKSEMFDCIKKDHKVRPKMIDVRDRLLQRFRTTDVASLTADVLNVLMNCPIKIPSEEDLRCVSMDKFPGI